MNNRINVWWLQRTSREKLFLILASCLLLVNILYRGIWLTFTEKIHHLKNQVQQERSLLLWMQKTQQENQMNQNVASPPHLLTPDQLIGFINQSLKAEQLDKQISHIEQQTNKKISLNFQSVAFDPFILWLAKLQQQGNLTIEKLIISTQDTEKAVGKVQIYLVLNLSPHL